MSQLRIRHGGRGRLPQTRRHPSTTAVAESTDTHHNEEGAETQRETHRQEIEVQAAKGEIEVDFKGEQAYIATHGIGEGGITDTIFLVNL